MLAARDNRCSAPQWGSTVRPDGACGTACGGVSCSTCRSSGRERERAAGAPARPRQESRRRRAAARGQTAESRVGQWRTHLVPGAHVRGSSQRAFSPLGSAPTAPLPVAPACRVCERPGAPAPDGTTRHRCAGRRSTHREPPRMTKRARQALPKDAAFSFFGGYFPSHVFVRSKHPGLCPFPPPIEVATKSHAGFFFPSVNSLFVSETGAQHPPSENRAARGRSWSSVTSRRPRDKEFP